MDSTSTSSTTQFPFPTDTLSGPAETVEYEPYDTALAARVTSLYAQLESLTTTVAQLRRDAPKKAARGYADALRKALDEDDELLPPEEAEDENEKGDGDVDVEMADADAEQQPQPKTEEGTQPQDRRQRRRRNQKPLNPAWKLSIPSISTHESERWESGEMGEVYNDALRTLLRLQGTAEDEEGDGGDKNKSGRGDSASEEGRGVKALATTVGKAERAGRAVEVVEKM